MTTDTLTTIYTEREMLQMSRDCPVCGAPAASYCKMPSGRKAEKLHSARKPIDAPVTFEDAVNQVPAFVPLRSGILGPDGEVTIEQIRGAKKAAPDVRGNSICVIIKTSRFTTRRTVSKADVTVASTEKEAKAPDQDMVAVAKDLLDSPELRRIATFDHITKLWVKARSVPSPLLRSSAYLLSVDSLEEMYGYLETRKAERAPLESLFVVAYPALVASAKTRLGPLFDPAEYPPVEVLRREFGFDWQVVEISTPDAKLRGVSQVIFEKEKKKAELVWTNAIGQINDALAQGMADVVKHLSDRLGAGDEPPKRFRESAIKRVTDFLDTFAQRNLAGAADLAALVSDARKLLSGVDAKELKKEAGTRKAVVAGFAAIKASLDTMLEDRPTRAAAIADDEV